MRCSITAVHQDEYPLAGQGDINLYAVFAELAFNLVVARRPRGVAHAVGHRFGQDDQGLFRGAGGESNRLIRLYDFENKKVFFPDVHASFKFCILNFGGTEITVEATDFVFFIHDVEELEERKRHIKLSGKDIRLLNPNTRTCPIFRSQRDAEITKRSTAACRC